MTRAFRQVDVFSAEPLLGNPVAVVHDADGLTDEQMQAFARWTNLSETTFLLEPTVPDADYRLRIFTASSEYPFAGHPTLGSAHAWLEAGGVPAGDGVVQECGVGLVQLRRIDGRLAFAAPDLLRSGPVDPALVVEIAAALGIGRDEILDVAWADNGPGWVGVRLATADAVLGLRPDLGAMPADVGVVGPYPEGSECAVEVRAFCPHPSGATEDPVTGSLNASLVQWLGGGVLPASYTASQGTVLGRRGRVHIVTDDAGAIWVGGDTLTTIHGTVRL
ncbi:MULTISPECIES: PhzF family phenazine biosynthesis protein [unclassified Nocardioides]|uniref:PhzF family phenazine biosynthesis protein n=1 Tax=unclassified Nocardioides TaxID=2615069 RepID=UPI0006FA7167|nr:MULTISPECIES: PhzF family phenazine biosynthesis protein [unclassified Nocardioides]KRA32580.1 phenazine biosynthesis protein PhzF [Nocardioides sp. Root614]KRA89233.1 phenazine biosynthesis protein PhzF [Nocardioides sp. Root682]